MRLFGRRNDRRNRNAVSPAHVNPTSFLNQAQSLIPAEVRMISGCEDEQTSADASNAGSKLPNPAGRAGGACTSALLNVLYGSAHNPYQRPQQQQQQQQLTYQEVLVRLRQSLSQDGYSQIPQLTSSRPLDVKETPFHLVGGHGRRRALLVGINYRGQEGQLSGCHNDVKNIKGFLSDNYRLDEVLVLTDDQKDPSKLPTRNNIMQGFRWLKKDVVAGDSLIFHYSGHGGRVRDYSGKGFFYNMVQDTSTTPT